MKPEHFLPRRTFGGLPEPYSRLETARVVVVPVPYDSTTEWRGGTREGPHAIIDASQYLELYDLELDQETYKAGIHTLPEVLPYLDSPALMVERVEGVVEALVAQGKLPVLLGGEHTITVGAVRACAKSYPALGVLQIDAHTDLRDSYLGTKYSHACVMRRVVETCPIVQVGVRSLSYEEHLFLQEKGLGYFPPESIPQRQGEVVAFLPPQVYVTIDLDGLDPSVMAAVGSPEPGGLGWRQVVDLLGVVAQEKTVVGFDLVELCPREGPVACAFTAAKLAYRLMGYIVRGQV